MKNKGIQKSYDDSENKNFGKGLKDPKKGLLVIADSHKEKRFVKNTYSKSAHAKISDAHSNDYGTFELWIIVGLIICALGGVCFWVRSTRISP